MLFAVISDIHGNIHALEAILNDAARDPIDGYIFAGDYCSYFPYPNEVIDTIKTIRHATVIHGNEEGYLFEYGRQDEETWTDGQFQSHYWCYRAIDAENHKYLRKLPKMAVLQEGDTTITVTHSSAEIYGDVEYREFSSTKIAQKYRHDPSYSRQKLLSHIQEYIHQSGDFHSAVRSLPGGVYIFGHTHVQWHAQYEDKTFINPGSCGLPLDGTPGAPYTLLCIENDLLQIEERRVPYDIDRLISKYRRSSLYEAAPVWSRVIMQEMAAEFEVAQLFLQSVNDYANKIGDPIRPFTARTWTQAYDYWANNTPDLLRFS